MAIFGRIFNLANLTLLTALTLSGIAAWYSILGLMAIFASAAMPIIIMGSALEVAKVVTTVWLHRYWRQASWVMKSYLVPALLGLAFLTSMGIFGFLSKAHLDQGVPTGDVQMKVSIIDEKIKTQKDNIEMARKALAQMDAQVEQRLQSKNDTEQAAERAVTIRKQQAKERSQLQTEITNSQKEIAKLSEQRAPIASELRKVEAEVGPIKYIAALIYGDNPDQNLLERAVRWVIILIVFVFDPLALVLVLASNSSRDWERKAKIEPKKETEPIAIIQEPVEKPTVIEQPIEKAEAVEEEVKQAEPVVEDTFDINRYEYLKKPWSWKISNNKKIEPVVFKEESKLIEELTADSVVTTTTNIMTDGVTTEKISQQKPYKEVQNGYVVYDGKQMRLEALKEMHPELFLLTADAGTFISTNFGTQFPAKAYKGDIFIRVDISPNRVYKFDGTRWIEINKSMTDSYLYDEGYIKYLVSKIDSGELDIDSLTDAERQYIKEYLER